ncbi:MAG: hypothetical protein U9R38_07665, partial [Candidatus Margulisiibacteriota bacterium]|nr:hypothetical protein [Candidatus Margulisiibacteriota bacterium]
GYNYIDLPVKTVKELEKELRKGHSSYIGNHNQIALAEEIGISHLSQLFSALSALKDPDTGKSWTEVLGYNVINLPVKTVKALEIELKKKHSPYIGNHNQIALAEEIGISNLGHLFSALSALKDPDTGKSWTEVLGYNVIDLPVKTVKALEIESKKNHSAYLGNHNQIALADKIGISNLGQLFSALSALKDPDTGKSWTEVLGYNVIDLPVKTVKALEIELKKKHSAYLGNHNQIPLAEEIGISNLGHLFSALSALKDPDTGKSWTEVLGYSVIYLPVKTVKALEIELKKKHSAYLGNHNQIPLAEEIGISNLGQLFSALSALKDPNTGKSWTEVLGYNVINLPVKTVKNFFSDLVDFAEEASFPYYIIAKSLADKSPEEAEKRFRWIVETSKRVPA